MKASTMIKKLQKLIDTHGDLDLVYRIDDEGNGFDLVNHDPSQGHYIEQDKEWLCKEDVQEYDLKINSICIN